MVALKDWPSMIGQEITLEGVALDQKLGAVLKGPDFMVWIQGLDRWPEGYYLGLDKGKRVRVTGLLIETHDLPVFVPKAGEPIPQGIPVPEGTDLKKAGHRYVIQNARWEKMTE